MLIATLAVMLLFSAPQQSDANSDKAPAPDSQSAVSPANSSPTPLDSVKALPLAPSDPAVQKRLAEARAKYDSHLRAAIHINQMAGNIHSEKDARALVDAIAEELTDHRHLMWAALRYRRRVAQAEFQAVSDPNQLIPEQRIVDVWNEYVREIDAPEEMLVTLPEVHRLRAGRYRMANVLWPRPSGQSIWIMPNIHPLNEDGSLAAGCRPLEMLDVLNSLYSSFAEVLFSRQRAQLGSAVPVAARPPAQGSASSHLAISYGFFANLPRDPVRPAEMRYQQAHGEAEYSQLLQRFFDQVFPAE